MVDRHLHLELLELGTDDDDRRKTLLAHLGSYMKILLLFTYTESIEI